MLHFKGRHFPKDIILMSVRWYVAYPLSYRNIEEMMAERGVKLDHSSVQKWVVHYAPKLAAAGGWMKPISRWLENGFTYTGQ